MISENEYKTAAILINCDPQAVKSVTDVESHNRGFVAPNKPLILFEGHIFWRQLKKRGIDPLKYVKNNKDILYVKWTKQYYKGGIKEYDRLNKAIKINKDAALASASYGLFQLMGFNYQTCGCSSVDEFVTKNSQSEAQQLLLFCAFLKKNKWDIYLHNKDWANFAKHYNGPLYAQNNYDKKLEMAYNKNIKKM